MSVVVRLADVRLDLRSRSSFVSSEDAHAMKMQMVEVSTA